MHIYKRGLPLDALGRQVLKVLLSIFMATLGPGVAATASGATINYPASAFTLVNQNADGMFDVVDDGFDVTGGQNGSGLPGFTDFTTVLAQSGVFQFGYTYLSEDVPPYDYAGYLIGSVFTLLADTDGQNGSVTVPVTVGQLFGFRVGTEDNTGGPGVLLVRNLEFTSDAGAPIPEPATIMTMVLGLGALAGRRIRHSCGGRK